MIKLIDFHMVHNIKTQSFRDKVCINFEVTDSIFLGKCCIRDEIRKKFLGLGVNPTSDNSTLKIKQMPTKLPKEDEVSIEDEPE